MVETIHSLSLNPLLQKTWPSLLDIILEPLEVIVQAKWAEIRLQLLPNRLLNDPTAYQRLSRVT